MNLVNDNNDARKRAIEKVHDLFPCEFEDGGVEVLREIEKWKPIEDADTQIHYAKAPFGNFGVVGDYGTHFGIEVEGEKTKIVNVRGRIHSGINTRVGDLFELDDTRIEVYLSNKPDVLVEMKGDFENFPSKEFAGAKIIMLDQETEPPSHYSFVSPWMRYNYVWMLVVYYDADNCDDDAVIFQPVLTINAL